MANRPATATASHRLHPQTSRMVRKIRIVVRNMVSDTAMPKAAARLSEERKASVKPSVSAISTQLTKPT